MDNPSEQGGLSPYSHKADTAMKILHTVLCFLPIVIGCTSKPAASSQADFRVHFSSKSYLTRHDISITVTQDELHLRNATAGQAQSVEQTYKLRQPEDVSEILAYLRSINFLKMEQPAAERLRDAPDIRITASYDGSTRSIDLGKTTRLPDSLARLRSMILSLASKYNPGWLKEAGLE